VLRVRDDRGRVLVIDRAPARVVSLVPSDTLSLCAVGAASSLVGRTDYCELPADVVRGVPSVGGTKNPRIDDICDLSPDLVLANQEENTRGDLEKLASRGVRVLVAFPKRVAEGLAHLARLARIFGTATDAPVKELVKLGYHAQMRAEDARKRTTPVRVFCPIWMTPLMTIHGATFISDMLDLCGAQNVFADRERRYPLAADVAGATPLSKEKTVGRDVRYPRVTLDEVRAHAPAIVILPDEPHPFSEDDARVFAALGVPVAHTSGKDLCWYGARSADGGIDRVRALVDQLRTTSLASMPNTA
jgi:ABC-type Fe3+-hydroxamate transport system substrate-binding protein